MVNFKRYHSIYDLASYNDCSDYTVRKVLESFRINVVKNNGKQCINDCDLIWFNKCYALRKKYGLQFNFISSLPQYIIKDLINRL